MSGIFVSYRREETAAYAGRLYDRLVGEFGQEQIFMDVDTITPGVDFVNEIEAAVTTVDVLFCVMGTEWLTITDENGKRRLDDPTDFVRVEVTTALKRDIRVVPVLVGGAAMPSADQLPPDLSKLPRRQALELSDARFHSDVDRLIESLRGLMDNFVRSTEDRTDVAVSAADRGQEAQVQKEWRVELISKGWLERTIRVSLTQDHFIQCRHHPARLSNRTVVKVDGETVAQGGRLLSMRTTLKFQIADGNDKYPVTIEASTWKDRVEKFSIGVAGRLLYNEHA